jgi:hypothetical protein
VDESGPRDLTETERAVLTTLLTADFPGADQLRGHVERLTVVGKCGCGCATIFFAHDAKGEGSELVGEAVVTGTDDCILLFVNARGDLDSMEYAWVGESPPAGFPASSILSVRPR